MKQDIYIYICKERERLRENSQIILLNFSFSLILSLFSSFSYNNFVSFQSSFIYITFSLFWFFSPLNLFFLHILSFLLSFLYLSDLKGFQLPMHLDSQLKTIMTDVTIPHSTLQNCSINDLIIYNRNFAGLI